MDLAIHRVKVIRLRPIKKLKREDGHEFYVRKIRLLSEDSNDELTLFSDDKETLKVINDE